MYENFFDGEFEDSGEGDLEWSEVQWQQHIRESHQDVLKFLKLYIEHKAESNPLEPIFKNLGWVMPMDESFLPDSIEFSLEEDLFSHEPSDVFQSEGLVTVHRHPLFVCSFGMMQYLHSCWGAFLEKEPIGISSKLQWNVAQGLMGCQHYALLGVQSLCEEEYTLCVCHFKHALSALNALLAFVDGVPTDASSYVPIFKKEVKKALFLLRDIWLQVMQECRALS